jgi:hypothetical protein
MIYGLCPACKKMRNLTEHHLYPKRFFGKKNNKALLLICVDCHRALEKRIPSDKKLRRDDYLHIARVFLMKEQECRVH